MPPKKRTSQSKHTPPTSPTTSTSHVTSDQHHHLRHAGPSISTRSRASLSAASSKPAPVPVHLESTSGSPPTQKEPHEKKQRTGILPSNVRTLFTKLMYILLLVVLVLFGWYLYGMIRLLEGLKEEVGWWGIVGDSGVETLNRWGFGPNSGPGVGQKGGAKYTSDWELEGSLNVLADSLGIPVVEVASAIKPLIPQESLTSIASKAEETDGSEAVRILFEDIK